MHAWLAHLSRSIQSRNLLPDGQPVLAAVSGGADSMVLMHVLHRLSGTYGWRLTIAHFNHQLRGEESDEDAHFVAGAAEKLGLQILQGRGDVRQEASDAKVSIEMAARSLRHAFLARTARECGASAIATGHHAGDQVEHFFLRLLRGGGKIGMPWRSPSPADHSIFLIRPFLDTSKETLLQFARDQGIDYRQDASNAQWDIPRNRIRHDLIPHLKNNYQIAAEAAILRYIDIASADSECVSNLALDWMKKGENRPSFDDLPLAVQRQAILHQLLNLGLEPDFELVESLRLKPGGRISHSTGIWVLREETGAIVIVGPQENPYLTEAAEVDLSRAGSVQFGETEFEWKILEGGELEEAKKRLMRLADPHLKNAVQNLEIYDAEKIGTKIILRHFQPGDRFQPIGMPRPAKLQDLWVNNKTPAPERRKRVVGCSCQAERLFFVEGLRIGEQFKLDIASTRGLAWQWRRPRSNGPGV